MKNFENLEGDLQEEGIARFLARHKCNEVCKALGLNENETSNNKVEKWNENKFIDHAKDNI
jgi:hypothetical protein